MSMQLGIPINCHKMPVVDFNDKFNEAQSYYQVEVLIGCPKAGQPDSNRDVLFGDNFPG